MLEKYIDGVVAVNYTVGSLDASHVIYIPDFAMNEEIDFIMNSGFYAFLMNKVVFDSSPDFGITSAK